MFLSARTLVPVQSLAEAGFFSRPVRLRGRLRLTNLDTRQLSGSWLGKLGGEVGSWPRHLIRSWPRKCEGLRLHTSTALPAMGTPLPFFLILLSTRVFGAVRQSTVLRDWCELEFYWHIPIYTQAYARTHTTLNPNTLFRKVNGRRVKLYFQCEELGTTASLTPAARGPISTGTL